MLVIEALWECLGMGKTLREIDPGNPPNAVFCDPAYRHFCGGRFSHVNASLFGATIPAKQRGMVGFGMFVFLAVC